MTNLDLDALKASYDRDGFVIIRNYLSDDEVNELRDHAVPLAESLLKKESDDARYPNLLKSLNRHDDWFDEKLNDGRHIPLVGHLVGDDIIGASAAWFDRPKGQVQGVDPHVDAIGRDRDTKTGATIWFALDPVSKDNGCVHYLRGSHRNDHPETILIPGIDTESEDACAAELEPGDAVIHNALIVHWSGGNTSSLPRRAVSFFYFGASCDAARMLRNKAHG